MTVEDLLRRRVVVLSGKGGVGKSILSATLAWIALSAGKRVLIVELDTIVTIPHFFGVHRDDSYTEIPLRERLSSFHIDGKSALEEYLRLVLRSRKLTERIFRSPIYQYFVEVAPGLKELMTIGKIWDLEQARDAQGTGPKYDLIVVDTPATGHTPSYFRMPQAAVKTIRRGFIRKEAQKVADLLQDSEKVVFTIVTTLEEMPVNEAIELHQILTSQLRLPLGGIFANKVYPPFLQGELYEEYVRWRQGMLEERGTDRTVTGACGGPADSLMLRYAESWRKRRRDNESYLERLRTTTACDIYHVPFLFSTKVDLDFINRLAQCVMREYRIAPDLSARQSSP
jgi:anion-transporting  ArsA/GET3 family ATPase